MRPSVRLGAHGEKKIIWQFDGMSDLPRKYTACDNEQGREANFPPESRGTWLFPGMFNMTSYDILQCGEQHRHGCDEKGVDG